MFYVMVYEISNNFVNVTLRGTTLREMLHNKRKVNVYFYFSISLLGEYVKFKYYLLNYEAFL